jgi:hypothetical protein
VLPTLQNLYGVGDNVVMEFEQKLDIADETTLDAICTAHTCTAICTALVYPSSHATGSLPAAGTSEGAIAYDSTTKTMKWSNGTVWATI